MEDSNMPMTTSTAYRRRCGLTLMEVMISLFVFSLLVVVFSSSLIVAKSASKINGEYAQAISLAQHKIDQLRAIGFGRLTYAELIDGFIDEAPTTSPFSFAGVDNVANYLPGASVGHPATATLKVENHPSDTRMKKITVTITWRSSPRRATDGKVEQIAYISNAD